MQDDRILKQINNGAIDYYYGLKFQTKLTFEKLIDFIVKKTNLVLDRAFHTVASSLDTGSKIRVTSPIQNHVQNLCDKSAKTYEYCKTIYGDVYVNAQTRIILPPYEVGLSNGESVFLESILYVFKNKSAVLRLTVPLKDVNSKALFENDLDRYILSFTDVCDMGMKPAENTMNSLKACYCSFLIKGNKKIKGLLSVKQIINIILSKHSVVINDIKTMPDDLKKDIYKILIAPTPNRKNVDYLEDARNCFANFSFTLNGMCNVFSNMNKCVTVMDESIVELGKRIYKNEAYECLIEDIRNGVEFAFCIIVLKQINNQYTFYTKGLGFGEESKIQNEYNGDRIFISLLLSEAYGSAREQLEFFEKSMKYFIDAQNANERLESINNILEQKNADKIRSWQNVLSIGGLMFSVLFGLPAITETIDLLRGIFSFVEADIPILTVNNFSFGLWLLVNSIISCVVLFKGKKH